MSYSKTIEINDDLLNLARIVLREWERPTEGVQRGELIARLSQYSKEARKVIRRAEALEKGAPKP